jgi:hypothetical protein
MLTEVKDNTAISGITKTTTKQKNLIYMAVGNHKILFEKTNNNELN